MFREDTENSSKKTNPFPNLNVGSDGETVGMKEMITELIHRLKMLNHGSLVDICHAPALVS